MYQDDPQTYTTLLKYTLKVMGLVLVLLMLFAGVSALSQKVDNQAHEAKTAQADKASRFWLAVAGQSQDLGVGSKLAHDINIRLNDTTAINNFKGNNNTYGGITDDIGFDPFNETGLNCNECGPLSADSLTKIEQIRNGNIEAVEDSLKPAPINTGFHVTPFNWSFGTLLFVLWALICPLSLAVGHFWAYELGEIRVNFGQLQWQHASNIIWFVLLAPGYMLYVGVKTYYNMRKIDKKVRTTFPDHMALIDQVDKSLASLSSTKSNVIEIRQTRDKVVAELKKQAEGSTNLDDDELKKCMDYLGGIKEFLDARHQYLHSEDELDWPAHLDKATGTSNAHDTNTSRTSRIG